MPLFYHIYNRVAGEPGYFPFGPGLALCCYKQLRAL
jgi:hypothetical protein